MSYIDVFKQNASKEQLEHLENADKILGYCGLGVAFELSSETHLDYITKALIEVNDEEFNENLRKATTEEEYLALEIPDNEMLRYYMEDGKETIRP